MNRRGLKHLFRLFRPVLIPDVKTKGRSAGRRAEAAIQNVVSALKEGDNILLYPSGRILRSPLETLGANSAVETILQQVPDVTIVWVKTTGLYGSAFSHASGRYPRLRSIFPKVFAALFFAGVFFLPRRRVALEIAQSTNFPRNAERQEMNRFMEEHFNQAAHLPLHVSYSPFFKSKNPFPRTRPSEGPILDNAKKPLADSTSLDEQIQNGEVLFDAPLLVDRFLKEQLKVAEVKAGHALEGDLGMDSLLKTELAIWLEKTFTLAPLNVESLETVQDCYLAASGKAADQAEPQRFPDKRWHRRHRRQGELCTPDGRTIAELFLKQVKARPNQPILADPLRGTLSYRRVLAAVLALKPHIEKLDGSRVGIMLPASTAAAISWLATMFSGKTPVMFNFTAGKKAVMHGIETTGTKTILTSKLFQQKLRDRGEDYRNLGAELVELESVAKRISPISKIRAYLHSHLKIQKLMKTKISDTAAVLFTSGSETLPKAVPLTHKNLIANLTGFSQNLHLKESDSLLGILPPFHSFGLTGTVVMPLCMGLKTVFHPNPTEGFQSAALIENARVTTLLATPTFLLGILRQPRNLESLRLTFVGAEKCPSSVYQQFAQKCPGAVLSEGYGITECSPVVSMNSVANPVPETIGRVLDKMAYAVVDDAHTKRVSKGETGLLLVRGDNVFSGYMDEGAASPFTWFENHEWYNTGDLVCERADGNLVFKGRKKRFIKVGGEMISLPAVESALEADDSLRSKGAESAVFAVGETHPRLVLATTVPISIEQANKRLRDAGLSALHRISEVKVMTELPKLGSGKINYRALSESVRTAASTAA